MKFIENLEDRGLLEDMYEEALAEELSRRGYSVKRQVGYAVNYKGLELKKRMVVDMIINDSVIVENKSTESHHPVFEAQLLTYLRQTHKRLGLVINFGQSQVKDGIHRVVHKLPD